MSSIIKASKYIVLAALACFIVTLGCGGDDDPVVVDQKADPPAGNWGPVNWTIVEYGTSCQEADQIIVDMLVELMGAAQNEWRIEFASSDELRVKQTPWCTMMANDPQLKEALNNLETYSYDAETRSCDDTGKRLVPYILGIPTGLPVQEPYRSQLCTVLDDGCDESCGESQLLVNALLSPHITWNEDFTSFSGYVMAEIEVFEMAIIPTPPFFVKTDLLSGGTQWDVEGVPCSVCNPCQ